MDKTFAETQGCAPFDWNKELTAAIARFPGRQEHEKMVQLAAKWPTCACGNQCAIIPRWEENELPYTVGAIPGMPKDDYLAILGIDFHQQIVRCNYREALEILHDIEHFSALIVREELIKINKAQLEPSSYDTHQEPAY
jgi:hypothetical protein